MDKSLTWILLALVVLYVVMNDDDHVLRGRGSYGAGNPYPYPGPSPSGTSWGQVGPSPGPQETNAWDFAVGVVNNLGKLAPYLGGGGSGESADGSYSVPYYEGVDLTSS